MKIRGKYSLFLPILFLLPLAQADVVTNCRTRFFQELKNFIVGNEVEIKNTFSFSPEQLAGVSAFLSKPESGIKLVGMYEKLEKFQKTVLTRYSKTLDPEIINAFGTVNEFIMVDGGFSAEVKIHSLGNKLIVEIPNIRVKSAGYLGKVSKGLDLGMARFFATLTRGVEYRLFLNKTLSEVEILPSKVVNRKLKNILHELGFVKTSELPDWGEVRGFREGLGPAAEYKMSTTVIRQEP